MATNPGASNMNHFSTWLMLGLSLILAGTVRAENKNCEAPVFSDVHIVEIIRRERLVRPNLPGPFTVQDVKVLRDGCYYIYQEWGVPKTPGMQRIFKLNRYGVIVDVVFGH